MSTYFWMSICWIVSTGHMQSNHREMPLVELCTVNNINQKSKFSVLSDRIFHNSIDKEVFQMAKKYIQSWRTVITLVGKGKSCEKNKKGTVLLRAGFEPATYGYQLNSSTVHRSTNWAIEGTMSEKGFTKLYTMH